MMQLSIRFVTISILLPVCLVISISTGMAVRELERDTAVTASVLLRQVDHVTSIARHTTTITARMAGQPCQTILENLTQNGALTPYIRSTGLIRNDVLICSSVTGARQQTTPAVYGITLSVAPGTFKIRAIEGTSSIPGQTAIIYASGTINRLTAFSVVDAQYFTDLMNSLDDTNHSVLLLRFSDGPVISVLDRDPPHTRAFIGEFRSAYSQAHLQVITPIHALGHYVLRYMMFLGPMSLLLTLAALYLLQRWQKRKMSLAEEIRKGMAAGEFSVHYQPMCETATGKCTGAEALLRWKRGDGSSMSPAVFIRAAEEEGVIISLTQHLFSLIADDFSQRKINAPFHLGVNIAAAHLGDSGFTADVMQLRGALDTSFRLVLEITERSLVEDTAVASKKLEIVREKGCRIAVDDFGTGYCSLNLLQSLPVDYLKIDKCFIDTLTSAGAEAPVLDTIISLSKRLGLTTIAEGVSTTHQRNWPLENQVPYVQGYLYGRPMAVPEFMAWYVANESNNPVKKG